MNLGRLFKSWLGFGLQPSKTPADLIESSDRARIEDGSLVYAVGDVHGMAKLLEELLHLILDDREKHSEMAHLIFLGDMIDRGEDSRSVIETVFELHKSQQNAFTVHVLLGNHEKMMFDFLAHPEKAGPLWLRHGGDATLRSFGVHATDRPTEKQLRYLRDEFLERLPHEHGAWLQQLDSKFTIGDYFFCHASINTRKTLSEQKDEDLLWSRRFPADEDGPQEKIIVHGHLPVSAPLISKYHINVDTGAYATGCLTAVKLVGNQRSFVSTTKHITSQLGNH